MAVGAFVAENLKRRLRVIDWANTHPEVREEKIEAPIIVVGLFRAGTTLLSYLLDQDRGQSLAAELGSGRQCPAADPRDLAARSASGRGARSGGDDRAAESGHGQGPSRRGRRPDGMHHGDGAGLEEPDVGDARQRPELRRVAALSRSSFRLRASPAGAADPAVSGSRWPLGPEVAAPLHRARCLERDLSGRHLCSAASGSGRGCRVQLQPHPHPEQELHRHRSQRLHRPALVGCPRGLRRPAGRFS